MNTEFKKYLDESPLMAHRVQDTAVAANLAKTYFGGNETALLATVKEWKQSLGLQDVDRLLANGASSECEVLPLLRKRIRMRDGETHTPDGKLTKLGRQARRRELSAQHGFARERKQIALKHQKHWRNDDVGFSKQPRFLGSQNGPM